MILTRSLLSRVSLKARSSIFFSSLFFASRSAPASFAAYHINHHIRVFPIHNNHRREKIPKVARNMKTLAAHRRRKKKEMQGYLNKIRTKFQITNAGFIRLYRMQCKPRKLLFWVSLAPFLQASVSKNTELSQWLADNSGKAWQPSVFSM